MNDQGITGVIVSAVPALMEKAEAETRQKHIDFTDMVYWAVKWNLPVDQYQYVFTDEAQDLSPMQRRLVEKCLAPNGRIFVVGDKNQAIYSFAGADSDSFDLSVVRPAESEVSPTVEYADGGRAALDALKDMDLMVMLEEAPAPEPKLPPQVERLTKVLDDMSLSQIDAMIKVLTVYKKILLEEAAREAV